jgi:hypothetical protein
MLAGRLAAIKVCPAQRIAARWIGDRYLTAET